MTCCPGLACVGLRKGAGNKDAYLSKSSPPRQRKPSIVPNQQSREPATRQPSPYLWPAQVRTAERRPIPSKPFESNGQCERRFADPIRRHLLGVEPPVSGTSWEQKASSSSCFSHSESGVGQSQRNPRGSPLPLHRLVNVWPVRRHCIAIRIVSSLSSAFHQSNTLSVHPSSSTHPIAILSRTPPP